MNTNEKFVITISREVGSGGRTVGRKLAEKLGVRYLDKALIGELTKQFNLSVSEIERIKGQKSNWLLDMLSRVAVQPRPEAFIDRSPLQFDAFLPTSEDIFQCESAILKELAEKSSCVIAGRSGFFILKDQPNKFDIFIGASRAKRVERIMQRQRVNAAQAEEIIDKVDTSRENFVKTYAKTSRYDLRNYDLVVNMDKLTEDEAVDFILRYIERA